MVQYTVHFSGRVQGVGFRYTTCNIAARYEVAGYVQNLSDGRVRLVAEGKPDHLKALVKDIQERMSGYIRDTAIDQCPADGQFGQPLPGALVIR